MSTSLHAMSNPETPSPVVNASASRCRSTRILVIMPSIPLHGMERANIQVMRLLKKAGAEVLFVTEAGWGQAVSDAVEGAGFEQVGINLGQNLGMPKSLGDAVGLSRCWLETSRRIRQIFDSFRPTHLFITNLSFFLFALPLPGRDNVETIFRLPNPPESSLGGWRQKLSDAIWKHLVIPRCGALVCNSAYSCEQLRRLARPGSRIELIYNSFPKRSGRLDSDAPRLRADRFNVVYLGRIQKSKGVDIFYAAARQLISRHEDVDFYLAGQHSWRNPFAEALIERNRGEGYEGRIHFLDHITDTTALLEQAQLHVCPSTSASESFPNVILEAKQAGLPSVGFATAGIPEAVISGKEGAVCSDNSANSLAQEIERYMRDPELLKRHGAQARKSLGRYDEERILEAWVRLFERTGSGERMPGNATE